MPLILLVKVNYRGFIKRINILNGGIKSADRSCQISSDLSSISTKTSTLESPRLYEPAIYSSYYLNPDSFYLTFPLNSISFGQKGDKLFLEIFLNTS